MLALSACLAVLLAAPQDRPSTSHLEQQGRESASPIARVHVLAGTAGGANGYLVETAAGLVAVDAPLAAAGAPSLREGADALHKPLLAVLVTRAHPDHSGGLAQLVAGQPAPVAILATEGVRPGLGALEVRTVKDGQTVAFGGARFTVHDLGAGQGEASAAWVLLERRPTAFIGDLALNGVHPDLSEGRSAAWLAQLDRARRLLFGVERLYPGHGPVAGYAALAAQRRYLDAYREAVAALAGGKPRLDEAGRKELAARMERALPGAPRAELVVRGADAVAAELAAAGK